MSNQTIPDTVYQATQSLADHLVASEPFVRFAHARQVLNADPEAQSLLKDLSSIQGEIRQKQQRGQVTQENIDVLRAMQQQVQATPVIMEYASTQQDAVNFLREINEEISQFLGVDFAALSRQTSCC